MKENYMINLIACVDNNFGIGKNNDLLIRIPDDMKHFKNETIGGVCVFGRKTAESLPNKQPLSDRRNIILTHNPYYKLEGFEIYNDVKDILDLSINNDIYICGGAEIYKLFMQYADSITLTSLSETYDADVYFPYAMMGLWMQGAMADSLAISEGAFNFSIEALGAGSYEGVDYAILKYIREKGEIKNNE